MLEQLTREAEALISIVHKMRELQGEYMKYCTDECEKCPIRGFCDWDHNIDFNDEGLESIERTADFIDMAYRYDQKEWEDSFTAQGINHAWNEERSGDR